MSVCLLQKDYSTNFCRFAFDTVDELSKLPTMTSRGKEGLYIVLSCSQASLAIGTNGENYILTGQNKWVEYNGNFGDDSSGGSSGSGGDSGSSDNGFIEL